MTRREFTKLSLKTATILEDIVTFMMPNTAAINSQWYKALDTARKCKAEAEMRGGGLVDTKEEDQGQGVLF